MFFKRKSVVSRKGAVPVKEKTAVKNDLFGTYIKVTPETPMSHLIAIQEWLKSQDGIHLKSMPVADISGMAGREGRAYVIIDICGYVDYGKTVHCDFRKVTFSIYPKVVSYRVEPENVSVLGKTYNKKDLAKALASLKEVDER